MINDEFENKIQEFITWLIGNGDSISTAERRGRRIKTLKKYIDLDRPDMKKIYKYIETRERKGIKKKTLRIEMKDLEYWYRFNGFNVKLPTFKKEPAPEPFIPSDELIEKILKYCDSQPNKEIWLRNKLIIETFIFTGARIGELVNLNIDDLRDGNLFIRSEKNEKNRLVPLPDGLVNDLQKYIEHYRMQTDPRALFTSKKGRMDYNYIRKVIKNLGKKFGQPELHPHSFRHYYGTTLIAHGMDIRMVQILMGHASISSTEIYTHVSQKTVGEIARDILNKLFRIEENLIQKVQIQLGAEPGRYGGTGI
ncbi:MAG: tyrosine-type recombinase/integrase [Candidatus Nanopusillus acidilobi]